MPREVLFQFTCDPAISGKPTGSTVLIYGIDSDEYCRLGMGIVLNEHPPPRSFLLAADGSVPIGVMSGNQAQQTEGEKQAEQQFLLDQVAQLDKRHEIEAAERARKDAIELQKREVSRG